MLEHEKEILEILRHLVDAVGSISGAIDDFSSAESTRRSFQRAGNFVSADKILTKLEEKDNVN